MTDLAQIEIPGLQGYTDRVQSIKEAMERSGLELGAVLSEAKEAFNKYPRSYWEEWLRICDVTVKTAERLIQTFHIFGNSPQQLKATTIKAIVVAPIEVQEAVKAAIDSGKTITGKDVKTLVKAAKTLEPGKTVYLSGLAAQYGETGTVHEIVGDRISVMIDDGIYPCFPDEVSLKPIQQKVIPLKMATTQDFSARMIADEIVELRSILHGIWLNPPADLRSYLSKELPNIGTWGDA